MPGLSGLTLFFRTKQVQDRLAANPTELPLYQRHSQGRLLRLREDTSGRIQNYLKSHVIWWSPKYSKGLRYRGDGCTERDGFPYEMQEHPAVKLHGVWKQDERLNLE